MSYTIYSACAPSASDIIQDAETIIRTTNASLSSADAGRVVSPATQYVVLPTGTDAQNASLPLGEDASPFGNNLTVFQCYVGLETTLTSAVGLISAEAQGGARYVRINTSNQIELYDESGNQFGPTSRGTISTSGMTHVQLARYSSASHMTVTLWLDGVWQYSVMYTVSIATGATFIGDDIQDMIWGEYSPAATNRGADLYLSHASVRSSSDAMSTTETTDGTWLARYPKLHGVGGSSLPPAVNATHTAFTSDYTVVNEYPNDGDAGYITTTTKGAKETYRYTAANPMDSGDTIPFIARRMAHACVGLKVGGTFLLRDTAANESTQGASYPGTSYVGEAGYATTNPAGSTWAYTDFDHFSGTSTGIGATTLDDSGATGWGTNTLVGAVVTVGAVTATITSNTSTQITFSGGWSGSTPSSPAAYTIAASKLEFGVVSASGADVNWKVTSLPGPEIWHYSETVGCGRRVWAMPAFSGGAMMI